MTGLYENVNSLQNNKNLTFLYRAPKIELHPLNKESIIKEYSSIFSNEKHETIETLAELTKGYAFAYQVVGYLFSKYNKIEKIYDELDQYLSIYVYDKIWSALPKNEKELLRCFEKDEMSTEELIKKVPFDIKSFSVYRDRLIKRGLIIGNEYGKASLSLPRFNVFVSNQPNI